MLMFLEDVGTPESQGIMDAAGMADSVVCNNEGVGKGDKLVKSQFATMKIDLQRTWQSNE